MIRKEVFETIGYYDESLAHEDLDLWVRASRVYSFEYISNIIALKRELSTSLSAHFNKKNNAVTTKLHNSTLQVLHKILVLNKTKKENKALLKRIRFETYKFIATRDFFCLFKLFMLELKVRFKSL